MTSRPLHRRLASGSRLRRAPRVCAQGDRRGTERDSGGQSRPTVTRCSRRCRSVATPAPARSSRSSRTANGGAFQVGITGYHTTGYDFGKQSQTDLEKGELAFGLPAALIVLVLVFGAVFAGLVPVLMAILSIIVALGLVAIISLEFSLSVFIVNMLTGMGLALGIDYSLFVVSRYREERGHGLAKEDAIARTGATASRAVLFSGSTFVVALLGMFIVPTSIMRSLALGAILVGIVSVAAALTLLPALLSLVGDRVNSFRVPYLGRNLGRADTAEGQLLAPHRRRRPAPAGALARGVGRRDARFLPRRSSACTSARTASARCPPACPAKQGYVLLAADVPRAEPGAGADRRRRRRRRARCTAGSCGSTEQLAARGDFGPGTIQTSARDNAALLTSPISGDAVGRPGHQRGARPPRASHPVGSSAAAAQRSTSAASPRRTSTTSTP